MNHQHRFRKWLAAAGIVVVVAASAACAGSTANRRTSSPPGGADASGGNGAVDTSKSTTLGAAAPNGVAAPERPDLGGEELHRIRAEKSYVEGHPEKVLDLWRERPWEPVGPVELAVVSQALAQAGDESAVSYIARLGTTRPVEADVLRLPDLSHSARAETGDDLVRTETRPRIDRQPAGKSSPWARYRGAWRGASCP